MKLYISKATLRTIEKFGNASLTHISATPSDHMSVELDATPLANEASKPACAHRIVDARNEIVKSGYLCVDCGAVFAGIHAPAAPSVEQDERGAFEAWAKGKYSTRYIGTYMDRDADAYERTKLAEAALDGWQARAALTSSGRCFFCGEPMDGAHEQDCPQAANVAQYRNEALSALLVDHSHAASAKDVDAVLKARDAIYSMFANVAQGAEAFPYQKTFDAIAASTSISGGHVAISVAKFVEAFGAAPPAQTALTDAQWLELRRIARTYNETGFPKHAREFFAALTASQSASGETK